MKLLRLFAAALLMTFTLTSCSDPAIQRDLGMSGSQYRDMMDYLGQELVSERQFVSAVPTENPICAHMDEGFEAYDVTTGSGTVYTLIIDSSNKSYNALMDGEKLVHGLIDNVMFPNYDFEARRFSK